MNNKSLKLVPKESISRKPLTTDDVYDEYLKNQNCNLNYSLMGLQAANEQERKDREEYLEGIKKYGASYGALGGLRCRASALSFKYGQNNYNH